MEDYNSVDEKFEIVAYELIADGIKIKYKGGTTYLYTCDSAGSENIETMKTLAKSGRGLGDFITANIRRRYASKSA